MCPLPPALAPPAVCRAALLSLLTLGPNMDGSSLLCCSLALVQAAPYHSPPGLPSQDARGSLLHLLQTRPLMWEQEGAFVLSGKWRGSARATLSSVDSTGAEKALILGPDLKPLLSPAWALLFAPQKCPGHSPTPPCLHTLYLQPTLLSLPHPGPPSFSASPQLFLQMLHVGRMSWGQR